MSAIVTDPVPNWGVGAAVLSCILAPPRGSGERSYRRRRATRRASRSGYGAQPRLLHVGQEQGLVNSSLEDRHAQLHAPLNDLAPSDAGFASELGGREMDCQQYESSLGDLPRLKPR